MQSHYKTLGLTNAASNAEIRRAYRILARRYHPDVNPNKNTEALFKEIANAYAVLSDPEKRKQHDIDLAQSFETFEQTFKRAEEALKRSQRAAAYARNQNQSEKKNVNANQAKPEQKTSAKPSTETSTGRKVATPKSPKSKSPLRQWIQTPAISRLTKLPHVAISELSKKISALRGDPDNDTNQPVGQLALLELSVSIEDAIRGVRKTVEIGESGSDARKVSVAIPPGVRTGSIVRLRSKNTNEDIVLVIRVETHSWLCLDDRGLTMEIPLTIGEAIDGGKVQVPSFGDPLLVTVEPRTQSGKEVRLKGQGLFHRDGSRGDLYIRFTVKIPDAPLPTEVRSITEVLSESYTQDIRAHLPKRLVG